MWLRCKVMDIHLRISPPGAFIIYTTGSSIRAECSYTWADFFLDCWIRHLKLGSIAHMAIKSISANSSTNSTSDECMSTLRRIPSILLSKEGKVIMMACNSIKMHCYQSFSMSLLQLYKKIRKLPCQHSMLRQQTVVIYTTCEECCINNYTHHSLSTWWCHHRWLKCCQLRASTYQFLHPNASCFLCCFVQSLQSWLASIFKWKLYSLHVKLFRRASWLSNVGMGPQLFVFALPNLTIQQR